MSWPKVKLGDCCEIVSGATPKTGNPDYWGGDIPWVSPKSLSKLENKYLDEPTKYITQAGFDSCSTRMLPAMSLLLSCRAPVGLTAINSEPICTNQGFKSLIPNPELLDINYLFHVMRKMRPMLEARGRGATFTEVSKSIVERFEIPLPPLDEQKRIATILDKVDRITKAISNFDEMNDEFLKSLFNHSFNTCLNSKHEWRALSEIAEVIDCRHKTPKYVDQGEPFLRNSDISNSGFNLEGCKQISAEDFDYWTLGGRLPQSGDILFSRNASIGKSVLLSNERFAMGQDLVLIRCHSFDSLFLWSFLKSEFFVQQTEKLLTGTTFKKLDVKKLRAIKIPKPSDDEVQSFISAFTTYANLKEKREFNTGQLSLSLTQELLT